MKGVGKGVGAAASTLLVALLVLVAASLQADAARRLGVADPVGKALSEPPPNGCSNDKNNQGPKCHGPPGQQAAAQVVPVDAAKPNSCTYDKNDPTGKKCVSPPASP